MITRCHTLVDFSQIYRVRSLRLIELTKMADIVQSNLEQMLPDLHSFLERDIFSKDEITEIISKRTNAEYKMIRKSL